MNQPLTVRSRLKTARHKYQGGLNIFVSVITLFSVAALIISKGFVTASAAKPPVFSARCYEYIIMALAFFVFAERIFRACVVPNLLRHLRLNWLDIFALLVGIFSYSNSENLVTSASWYILVSAAIHIAGAVRHIISSSQKPARLLAGSFAVCILTGSLMLSLPRATASGEQMNFLDALFTATSATCVTGLIVEDTGSYFSLFGQSAILVMIQLGGLGLMTFGTLFIMLSGRRLDIKQSAMVGEMLSEQTLGSISRTVTFIVGSTICIELTGAFILSGLWAGQDHQIFKSVFHSISAFCNAGFALHSDSLVSMRDNWRVYSIFPMLIVIGGIGFPVLMNLVTAAPKAMKFILRSNRRVVGLRRPKWTLQTKLVLTTTVILLLVGWAGLMVFESIAAARGNDLDGNLVSACWFQSVSARTAGFNSIDLTTLSPAGKLWMVALMMVGGSPASTAGGMKTLCLAVTVLVAWSVLRGRSHVEVFGRMITPQQTRRTITLAILFVATTAVSTLALVAAQPSDSDFLNILFESASACGTVGLSLGQTAELTLAGKWVIIISMFIGRVGPLTLLMSLATDFQQASYTYPAEELVVS